MTGPRLFGLGAGRPVRLGEDLDGVAPHPLERAAEDGLRRTLRIDVGRVEGGDPGVERGMHARVGGILLDLAAVGDPIAVGQRGHFEARASEVSVLHGPERTGIAPYARWKWLARRPTARPDGASRGCPWGAGDLLARHGLRRPRRASTPTGRLSRVEVWFDAWPRRPSPRSPGSGLGLPSASAPSSRASARTRARKLATVQLAAPSDWPTAIDAALRVEAAPGVPRGRPRALRSDGWSRSATGATSSAAPPSGRGRLNSAIRGLELSPREAEQGEHGRSKAARPIWASRSGILLRPRAPQRSQRGVAAGNQRGVLGAGVAVLEVARLGER